MRLKEWLSHTGMSVPEFASRAGVAHTTIYRILCGGYHPRRPLRERIVSATGGDVTEAELLVEAALGPGDDPPATPCPAAEAACA